MLSYRTETRRASTSTQWALPVVAYWRTTKRRTRNGCTVLVIVFSMFLAPHVAAQNSGAVLLGFTSKVVTARQLQAPHKAVNAMERATKALAKGKMDEAYKQSCRALDAYPNYSFALAMRGLLNLEANKTAEAAADFENAIRIDPAYGPPYVMLGALYNQEKRYNDAFLVLTKGVELLPSAWQAHFQIGQALFGKGDVEAALRAITEAIRRMSGGELAEDRAAVHFSRAHVLVQLRHLSEARSEFEQVVHIQPDGQFGREARQMLGLFLPSTSGPAVAQTNAPH
jgi:tetratricopeptide (TPR) repeat protein